MTMIESIQHHGAIHATPSGQIPLSSNIEFVIEGSFTNGTNNSVVLVREGESSNMVTTAAGFTYLKPCGNYGLLQAASSAISTAGSVATTLDPSGNTRVTLNTSGLDTGDILTGQEQKFERSDAIYANARNREYTGSQMTSQARGRFKHAFAVCYRQDGGHFHDSGIRVTVSKMSRITHGITTGPYEAFSFYPGSAGHHLPSTGQSDARNVLPNSQNMNVEYYSEIISGTPLGPDQHLAIVTSSYNSGKPCASGYPAAAASTLHSGSLSSNAGTQIVQIPQHSALSSSHTYTVCYSVDDGSTADETWQDTFIRLTVSDVESIESIQVLHTVNNFISTIASREEVSTYNPQYYKVTTPSKLPLTYSGGLVDHRYLSIVDQTLNANFPCTDAATASTQIGDSGHAPVLAGSDGASSAKTSLFNTSGLDPSKVYAICYGDSPNQHSGSGYRDTGIRVKRSIVTSIQYESGYSSPAPREMTSVEYETNRIPMYNSSDWADDITLKYVGSMSPDGSNIWISFIAVSPAVVPCVYSSVTDPATATNTGKLNVSNTGEIADVPNGNALSPNIQFAVCYTTSNSTDTTYRDSYIRVTTTELAALQHWVGRYTDENYTPGRKIRHRTAGHLPSATMSTQQLSYEENVVYDCTGPLNMNHPGAAVSFVATDDASVTFVENGATYNRPCTSTYASQGATSTTSGVIPSGTNGGVFSFTSANLDTSKIYALCYFHNTNSGSSSYDSGLRFTISKIHNVKYHTGDSPDRDNTAIFLSTNRLSQTLVQQLQYQGSSDVLSKWISIVPDSAVTGTTSGGTGGTGNPCVQHGGVGQSSTSSGPVQLGQKRTCDTYDEFRARTFMVAMGRPTVAPYFVASNGSVVQDWAECKAACQVDAGCGQVAYNKVDRMCYPTPKAYDGFNWSNDYLDQPDGRGKWISAACQTAASADTALIPQFNTSTCTSYPCAPSYLSPGGDGKETYALCYSEYASDTTSASSGSANDIWLDSYIRFRITPMAALETSGTLHTTTGHVPIVGTPVAYDYFDASLEHHFSWIGPSPAGNKIKLISAELNDNYPCIPTLWANNPSGDSTRESIVRGSSDANHLLDTTGLDTTKTFAVCIRTASVYMDSGIRVTVSKVMGVSYASGYSGTAHDANDARIMTSKAALTNTFPRQSHQVLTVVPSNTSNSLLSSNNVYVSLVATTLNSGKPCIGPDAYAPADNLHSGAVHATNLAADIPQTTLLGRGGLYDDYRKFRLCYAVGGNTPGNWEDSYITVQMTEIVSFNVHTPSKTGLRGNNTESNEVVMKIRTVGQIPSQRANQTTTYSVDTQLAGYQKLRISLVDTRMNVVEDTLANGTNSNPYLNSGYRRPDPCHQLRPVDEPFTTWSDWKTSQGTEHAAHGELVLNSGQGSMVDLDTTLLNTTQMFAMCYSSTGTFFHDSGIRITVSQVQSLLYFDNQGRVDRTREITSVFKSYNVLPMGSEQIQYIGHFGSKLISFVLQTENNNNPCVDDSAATGQVQATSTNVFVTPSKPVDQIYAVCYATQSGQVEVDDSDVRSRWIRNKNGGSSTLRDSYIRVFASEINNVTLYGRTFNNRGQIPGHTNLHLRYNGALSQTGAQIALVAEHLNVMTIGATTYSFPCSTEFGGNAQSPEYDPTAVCRTTHNCTATGKAASNQTLATVQWDTTNLHTQYVYALCYSPDGSPEKWRDSAIRLTVPEIQMLTRDSGHPGTPARVYKSWDTTDGDTVLDRPTSRLAAYPSIQMNYIKHQSTPAARAGIGTSLAIVKVSYSSTGEIRNNPCTGMNLTTMVFDAVPAGTSAVCPQPNQCTHSGEMVVGSNLGSGVVVVPQNQSEKLHREDGDPSTATYTVCYRSHLSNSGAIKALMHSHPESHSHTESFTADTVYWEDTYVFLKPSGVNALTAAGVTHVTTGQIPNTNAESATWGSFDGLQPRYPFSFQYTADTDSLASDRFISLVDETLSPQANGEGRPCSSASDAASPQPHMFQATNSTVTGWNTANLDSSKVYAVCYDGTSGVASGSSTSVWSDSGIRVTVSHVYAITLASGFSGPTNKEDVRARPMTSTILPTNTLPRSMVGAGNEVQVTYLGSLPAGSFLTLVAVSASNTKNPCLIPDMHTSNPTNGASDTAIKIAPSQATQFDVNLQAQANEMLAGGNELYAVCYDVAPGLASTAVPQFKHSPECDCHLENDEMAIDSCLQSCNSANDVQSGNSSSRTWRDSYIRVKMADVHGLGIHHSVATNTSSRKVITIRTAGGIPATTSSNKQVGFEHVGSLTSDGTNGKIMLVWDERTLVAPDDTGISHYQPCSPQANLPGTTPGPDVSAMVMAQAGSQIVTNLTTEGLNTTKRFAVCYTRTTGMTQPADWHDSGLRVTVSKVQSLHYIGDMPYTDEMLRDELQLMQLRNRQLTSAKTALSRLPRAADIKLRWDNKEASNWPNERENSTPQEQLAPGKHLSIVSTTLNGGNPCVHPSVATGLPSASGTNNQRLTSGVMSGTEFNGTAPGIWVTVPQSTGNLLAPSSVLQEYTVCFAEGDGSVNDITWRDTFIHFETSDVESLTQVVWDGAAYWHKFGHSYKTTGQLASNQRLYFDFSGPVALSAQINLVDSTWNALKEEEGLDAFSFPCGNSHVAGSASGDFSLGPVPPYSGSMVGPFDTTGLHLAKSGVEVIYAVCFQSHISDAVWQDTAIRLSVSQVYEILRRSGFDRGVANNTFDAAGVPGPSSLVHSGHSMHDTTYGIDTHEPTMARHMTATYSETNRLPLSETTTFTYVTNANSLMELSAGNGKEFSFVAVQHETEWGSACDRSQVAASSTSLSTGNLTAATGSGKEIQFSSLGLTRTLSETEMYAVCYNHDGSDGSWRDTYIRVKFTLLQKITTMGVDISTSGQIPNVHSSDELEFVYHHHDTVALPDMWISLVFSSVNNSVPCAPFHASQAADCSSQSSCNDGRYSGVHRGSQVDAVHTLHTSGLHVARTFAVCFARIDGTVNDATWADSGIRVSVSKIHTFTLPFDGDWSDSCRSAGHLCTTKDRDMTSHPRPTNRIARYTQQMLKFSGNSLGNNVFITLVDASLNNHNPCVDPAIPGAATSDLDFVQGGSTSSDSRQKTSVITAVNHVVVIEQSTGDLIRGPGYGVNRNDTLGKTYTFCYAVNTGGWGDLTWRDSYVRVVPSDVISFGAKSVEHLTYGVIPHHEAGLEYFYGVARDQSMDVSIASRIALVQTDAVWNQLSQFIMTSGRNLTFYDSNGNSLIPSSPVLTAGDRIIVGSEERTIVFATTSWAEVSTTFSTDTSSPVPLYVSRSEAHYGGEGFVNKPYDPCWKATGNPSAFNSTNQDHVGRAEPDNTFGTISRPSLYNYKGVTAFKTTEMKPKTEYALCYSPNVGEDASVNDWFDAGVRVEVPQLTALEYSGHKRGVLGFPTAWHDGYAFMGTGDCVGSNIEEYYYYNARLTDLECRAKCDAYSDCVAYQASSIPVPKFGGREKHCKIYKATSESHSITGVGASWGDSVCTFKTSGDDQITRGKNHRKMQSVAADLQPSGEIAARVLPMTDAFHVVYAGTLPKSKYISLVALNESRALGYPYSPSTSLSNPCSDASNPGSATSLSSGPVKSCESLGPGYTNTEDGANYPRPGGTCRPSGTVCADQAATFMATLHATGCPNTNKNSVYAATMATWEGYSNMSVMYGEFATLCQSVVSGTSTYQEMSACCGQDSNGVPLTCTPTSCQQQSITPDCSHEVSFEGNKEVSFNLGQALNQNYNYGGYTVCYTDGDGSTTDPNWKDSLIHVHLSKITSITASGVTHTDHGHLASHDSVAPLEVEYSGLYALDGYSISFIDETLNSNNPCASNLYADGTDPSINADAKSVSSLAVNRKVMIKTSHLNSNLSFAVCYNETSNWFDSGIRVRITELTNVRYNEAQVGGNSASATGQYTRDLTAARSRIAPPNGDDYFNDQADGYALLNPYEDIRTTTAKHTIPQAHSGNLQLSYRGTLMSAAHVAVVKVTDNYGDPCVLGSLVTNGPNSHRTSVANASSKSWSFSSSDIQGLSQGDTFTLCYDPRSAPLGGSADDPYDQNARYGGSGYRTDLNGPGEWKQGLGVPVEGWRDSYIRFTISVIATVESHGMIHRTQGLIASSTQYTLSFTGTISTSARISLVKEDANSYYPCAATNGHQPGAAGSENLVAQQAETYVLGAATGKVSISVDTLGLDRESNYAVCFYSSITTQWKDSGIRVWTSRVMNIGYNHEQRIQLHNDSSYIRLMWPQNSVSATDSRPYATNTLPMTGIDGNSFKLYAEWAPGSHPNEILETNFSFVSSDLIGEPCASLYHAGGATDSLHLRSPPGVYNNYNSKQYTEIDVDTSGASGAHPLAAVPEGTPIAVCYYETSPQWGGQWRDTHIRVMASKVHIVESYGIEHKTTGMVAQKGTLRLRTVGTLPTTSAVVLVDASINDNYPCHQSFGYQNVFNITSTGVSVASSRWNNSHTLNTRSLSPSKLYAVCYNDTHGWRDAGLRLTTPTMTTMSYSAPARVISSATCFTGDLWGAADCNPSKTCNGASCTGGDPSSLCGTGGSGDDSSCLIPRDSGAQYTIGGDAQSINSVVAVSFVLHTRGNQPNNPCRDATESAAASSFVANADQRHHSGELAVSSGQFVLPQLSDHSTYSELLKEDGTFSVCYKDNTSTWYDSYIRVRLSKIASVQGSGMLATTRGVFANVPSMRLQWVGSLGFQKYINIVEATANNDIPCAKANAEQYHQCSESCAFDSTHQDYSLTGITSELACKSKCLADSNCHGYTYRSDSFVCELFNATGIYAGTLTRGQPSARSGVVTTTLKQSGWLQADASEEFVDFDTTSLKASVLYTVCYGDIPSPSAGDPSSSVAWFDSNIRLRFIEWNNPEKSRVVSGAASLMTFDLSFGGFSIADRFALIKDAVDCSGAPASPLLSNGTHVQRIATYDSGSQTQTNELQWGFAMPSGTHAGPSGTGWRTCHPTILGPTRLDTSSYETCEEPGAYGDMNLEEGNYVMCFCDSDSGNSGCDHVNEWTKVSSSNPTPEPLHVVATPRIGRATDNFGSSSHVGAVRAISGRSQTYNIKTSAIAGLEISDGDKLYFTSQACDHIPSADASNETAPISVQSYDTDSTSGTYKAGRVSTPSGTPLTSMGLTPRSLVSCFATQETLTVPLRATGPDTSVTCVGTCTCQQSSNAQGVFREVICSATGTSAGCDGKSCTGGHSARDFVMLTDKLEITSMPRLGTNAHGDQPGVIRALDGSSPMFNAQSLKPGDQLFFKQMTTFNYQITGSMHVPSGSQSMCDYANGETCGCSNTGVLSCSNSAHSCSGFTCTNTIPEPHDDDCIASVAAPDGYITHQIPGSNQPSHTSLITGQTFYDVGETGQTVTHTVTVTHDFKYAIDGDVQKVLTAAVGNTYHFDLSSETVKDHAFLFSASEGGEHNDADVSTTGMIFMLDGRSRTLLEYLTHFGFATSRSITYTPTGPGTLYYYSHSNNQADTLNQLYTDQDNFIQQSYERAHMGAHMVVNNDDSGTFQLPTDTPLTASTASTPRYLTACFIPAGAISTLQAPKSHGAANCTYNNPHDSTCSLQLENVIRLEDTVQILPEPTQNLKLEHNQSEVHNLKFNAPSYGTYWRTTGHWCQNSDASTHPCGVSFSDRQLSGSQALCCQAPPNYAGGSVDDIVVLKKESGQGSGNCDGVELITDDDYFIGGEYSKKMLLTTIDTDLTSQTATERSDLTQKQLRAVSEKGAEASHHAIAQSKINELAEGFYTICYATAESEGNENADFVKLSVSIEIVPHTSAGPTLTAPSHVTLGQNIDVVWAASNGWNGASSAPYSWVGLFKDGDCPNGSGEFQNKCYMASQNLPAGNTGSGTISFKPGDYQLSAGTYVVRFFDGTSRDKHGALCQGLTQVERGNYVHCIIEATHTSGPIIVQAGINTLDEKSAIPGLEMVLSGSHGRYAGHGQGLPGRDNVIRN
jgi:hypothetical protein